MNKKKILIIVVFVISICIIGLSVYKIIEKKNIIDKDPKGEVLDEKNKIKEDIKNNDNANNNEESTMIVNDINNYSDDNIYIDKIVGNVDVNNDIVKKLYSYVNVFTGHKVCTTRKAECIKYEDDVKDLSFKIVGYIFKNDMISKDIPDDIKIGVVVEYLKKSKKAQLTSSDEIGEISNKSDCYIFDLELIRKYAKIIFGNDTEIKFDTVPQAEATVDGLYENNTKYLAHGIRWIGFSLSSPYIGSKLTDVVNNTGEIILYQKTYYMKNVVDESAYYYDNYNEDNLILVCGMDAYSKNECDIDNAEMSTYKYTFKYDEENKHYYFYSVEKAN